MKKYLILSNIFVSTLQDDVCTHMSRGYVPHGSMTIGIDGSRKMFYQPMTLDKDHGVAPDPWHGVNTR